jgi:hypothetical protein
MDDHDLSCAATTHWPQVKEIKVQNKLKRDDECLDAMDPLQRMYRSLTFKQRMGFISLVVHNLNR